MSDSKETKALQFVQKMLEQSSEDKGLRATLRLAANPNTESRAWPVLIRWGVDVSGPEKDAYCLVMALAARYTGKTDGTLSLGEALRECFANDNESSGASSRLRRLFTCDSVQEAKLVLRPMLSLIQSRIPDRLCLSELLEDLIQFNREWSRQKVKTKWAMDFYRKQADEALPVEKEAK